MSTTEAKIISINPGELICETEVARDLHLRPGTLCAWRIRNRGPCWIKIGKKVFYRRSDIASWVSAASHADQLALLAHIARDRRDAIGSNDQASALYS